MAFWPNALNLRENSMRVLDTVELDRFRAEVRDWIETNKPKERRPLEGPVMRAYDLAWQKKQYEGGWAGISWPKEYGGRGLGVLEQLIWFEEYAKARAPYMGCLFIALSHAGPTLIVQGSPEHKAKHLPAILSGEEVWCQGFSEPGAGSDLATLSCKGEIDGDHLVVNGSKIWTTFGEVADYQELLVRTGTEPRHKGITWIIGDMHAPGVTIRPIKAMSGITHFCQVFYDNVRIPLKNVLGEINGGWKVAITTLGFERGTATISHQIDLATELDQLIEIAKTPRNGVRPIDDDQIAAELAQLKAEVTALRSLTALSISRGMRETVPGAEGNIVALFFAELTRRMHATAITVLGPKGLQRDPKGEDWPLYYMESFKWGIGGGTNEIRRNTIGERVLGLPKQKNPV
jgi:alkylation response protein AidB-like acyl-CoA dehydrogenase